jgi:hypothetical protein
MEDRETLRAKLNLETATLDWPELERHFARGVVVKVGGDVDLIEAALLIAQNDAQQVRHWMETKRIARAMDDDALRWHAQRSQLWTVVVAPWVLVQDRSPDRTA